jgi:type IV pilus assembly protein PilY1
MNAKTQKFGISTAISLLMLVTGNSAFAAPGTLADTPLFVTTAVEPNIFFTYDDSGSMGWETMVQNGTAGFFSSSGVPYVGNRYRYYFNPTWESDCNVMPPENLVANAWVFRNHHGNKNYYNPDVDYLPWAGFTDDLRTVPMYGDATITSVREFPYKGNDTVNITQNHWYNCSSNGSTNSYFIPTYFVWDPDTDVLGTPGVIDPGDVKTEIRITPTTTSYPSGRSYADEIQNFANWFQYYRTRELAAKAAIGRVMDNAPSGRMGLDAFNDGHRKSAKTMTDNENKRELLEDFYDADSGGGTPAHSAMKRVGDRFLRTSGTRPILPANQGGECQQNFNILMTDGFWNNYSNPGVNNADNSSSDNLGFDGDENESNDGGNYEDNWSNTLADIAMWYYENDLQPTGYANRVPVKNKNLTIKADHQHLETYTIGFGLNGTLDPTLDPATQGPNFWPNPMDTQDEERVDDLWHAAYNGRGLFLSAQNPAELEDSLNEVIEDITEKIATSSAVSVTSARLTTDSAVFVSEFNSSPWQGTVYAYPIVEDPLTGVLSLSATENWSAADVLNGQDLSSRVILTTDNTPAGGSVGIPFTWAKITPDMKADLRTNASGGTDSDTIAEARLDYLRGDRSNEGGGLEFRPRATLLGDIVNSGPAYVAGPNLRWPDEAPFPTGTQAYSEFKSQKEDRSGVIYVGANDGMLHGFNAENGSEVLAYIPSNLFSANPKEGLHYLTQQNYSHKYYTDLSPTVSDVFINGAWQTILIGGQRAGGRGYFSLNVTDPANFSETGSGLTKTVMWEFTSDDDNDLGYTFSRPQIGLANDGEWVAVFGNGYNSDGGDAKLFIVKIKEGLDGNWTTGDYTEIATGSGTPTNKNGLSSPALADLDGNGTIDRAYAGDLNGNMWSFDLSGLTTASWTAGSSVKKLFTTIGNRPITSKPAISFHPTVTTVAGTNEPNIMVAFGTGQYMVAADKNSTYDNYFYGVWDSGAGSTNLTSSSLIEQTFRGGFSARVLTQNPVDYTTKKGWFIELVDGGERTVTNPIIRSGFVFFNTTVPTADACAAGGYGYRHVVDLETGGTPKEPVIDVNKDGVVDDKDTIDNTDDVQSAEKFDRLLADDTITEKHIINERELTVVKDAPTRSTGRVSWQELLR